MEALQPWQNFYMLLGGASATLVGLMFIAISIVSRGAAPTERATVQLAYSAFLSPTFIHFVYVLVTAAVVLVPALSESVLGVLLVLAGAGSLGYILRHLPFVRARYRIGTLDRSDLVWYSMMPAVCYVLYLDAGIGLLRSAAGAPSRGQALNILAAASVLLIVIGVRNAWDLVVFQVMREIQKPDENRP